MTNTQPAGYLAVSAQDKSPGVLVLHPWWGLNKTIRNLCDRLAKNGFTAFAPDLFNGKIAKTILEAEELATGANPEKVRELVASAAVYLSGHPAVENAPIALIGFSFGAYFALDLSNTAPALVRSVTLFYGTGAWDFGRSQASYQGHFAKDDPFEPPEAVNGLEQTLKQAGRPVQFYTYPGTGHWFFEPDREDAYDRDAAELSWERTLAFLKAA